MKLLLCVTSLIVILGEVDKGSHWNTMISISGIFFVPWRVRQTDSWLKYGRKPIKSQIKLFLLRPELKGGHTQNLYSSNNREIRHALSCVQPAWPKASGGQAQPVWAKARNGQAQLSLSDKLALLLCLLCNARGHFRPDLRPVFPDLIRWEGDTP